MIFIPEQVSIASELPPNVIRDRLRARAKEWRESTLTETATKAGIIGWRVKEDGECVTVRARTRGGNAFLPHFVGIVRASDAGSHLSGELRISWYPRLFMFVWFASASIAPALALVEPIPAATIGERLLEASLLSIPCAALFAAGRWLVDLGSRKPATAIREVLAMATSGIVETSSETIAPRGV